MSRPSSTVIRNGRRRTPAAGIFCTQITPCHQTCLASHPATPQAHTSHAGTQHPALRAQLLLVRHPCQYPLCSIQHPTVCHLGSSCWARRFGALRCELMPPKSTRAAASATPTPVDPTAPNPIHSACARRADAHGGLSQTAVRDVLHEVGFMGLVENIRKGNRGTFRDAHLTTVAEKRGVP